MSDGAAERMYVDCCSERNAQLRVALVVHYWLVGWLVGLGWVAYRCWWLRMGTVFRVMLF